MREALVLEALVLEALVLEASLCVSGVFRTREHTLLEMRPPRHHHRTAHPPLPCVASRRRLYGWATPQAGMASNEYPQRWQAIAPANQAVSPLSGFPLNVAHVESKVLFVRARILDRCWVEGFGLRV